jgi:hypothetical protein
MTGPTPSSPAWWCPRCSTPHQHGEPADGCECGWEQPPDPWPDAPRTVAAPTTDHTPDPPF